MSVGSAKKNLILGFGKLGCLGLGVLLCTFPAWSQQPPIDQPAKSALADSQEAQASVSGQQHAEHQAGSISGKVVDQSGANIGGAVVKLMREGQSSGLEVTSDDDGLFAFSNVAPGPFQLTISSPGLASHEFSGTLQSGEAYVTPLIMLVIPTQVTEVRVGLPPEELAEVQIKEEEKQRVFGVIPNFYVSYAPNAAPITTKHKFELAWKSASDPVTLVGVGVLAGIGQAGDRWGAYGQGAQGYAKRYGASYANVFASTFIGGAVMPSVLKQDPRYFYKGSGSKRSRILYAVASSVICKGDNGRWQPNYSNVIGSFAGAGLQAVYLPANDRRGSGFIVSSALIRLGETSLAGVLQEFVFSKLTKRPRRSASKPQVPTDPKAHVR
jgi:Carboxypeptidase regulatory-like domain